MKGIKLVGNEDIDVRVPTLYLNNRNDVDENGYVVVGNWRFNHYFMFSNKGTFMSSNSFEEKIAKYCDFLIFQ